MKKTLPILLAAALWLTAPAHAESVQQTKMKECATQAKGKTGAERRAFMKECLAGKATAAGETGKPTPAPAAEKKLTAQQMKMRECNSQAKGMKGEERKNLMKECLSKKK